MIPLRMMRLGHINMIITDMMLEIKHHLNAEKSHTISITSDNQNKLFMLCNCGWKGEYKKLNKEE